MASAKHGKLTVADFFSGIGGLGLGFRQAGYRIVYANDNNPYSCQTYEKNVGKVDCRDIRDVDPDKLPDFDVLLAGFPCQPFSMIGKRKGLKDDRGKMFYQVVRILNAKRPQAFVLENVKHLGLYDGGAVLRTILKNLDWLGYKVYTTVLDSKDFGVAQHRERLYIVGFLNEEKPFKLNKRNKRVALSSVLEKKVDSLFYLSNRYYRGLMKHKKRHAKKGNGFGCNILNPNEIANTIVSGNMGRERNLIQEKPIAGKNTAGVRKLTIRECARLQGFPDTFTFPVSNTQAYEQLGNAVTVPVAKAIAIAVKRSMETPRAKQSLTKSAARAAALRKLATHHGQETTTTQGYQGAIAIQTP